MTFDPAEAGRSALYGLLAELLSFPTEELVASVRSGELHLGLDGLLGALPYPFGPDTAPFHDHDLEFQPLQTEYIRLFDVPDGPACPLYTGVYAPSRREAMEEIVRFYRHFGLRVAEDSHDLPDSVPTLLEFLHFLAHREAVTTGEERQAARAAQRDLLDRHLRRWSRETAARFERRSPSPFYGALVALTANYFEREAAYLA